MGDWLYRLNGGQMIGLVSVLGPLIGGALIAVVGILATQWRRVRLAEMEANLKQQMLDKGMPAAEIEQVLKASSHPPSPAENSAFTGAPGIDKFTLVKFMAENSLSGEDIVRVLRAFDGPPDQSLGSSPASKEKAALVEHLIGQEMPAEEIERVLRAFHGQPEDGRIRKEWAGGKP
jgi:hypothetical protein